MKKILLFLTTLLPFAAYAQLNGDGYYRIQNNQSERYIILKDNAIGEVNESSASADVSNLTSWSGFDYVKSSPGSVFYIQQVGTKYNLIAQGTSIYDITGGKKYIDIIARNGGAYYLFEVTASGVAGHLYDSNDNSTQGSVTTKGDKEYMYWRLKPINTSDNYIGLEPTVQTSDGWYGTVYASYPFKLASSNVTVYYVDGVHEGQFQLKKVESEVIPAATPLIFKSNSNDPAQNKVIPVFETTTAPTDNKLGGTYFSSTNRKHKVFVEYDATTMRVLGKDSNGNLVFTTAKSTDLVESKYIPMNTCWLNVAGLTGDFKLVRRDEFTGVSSIEVNTKKNATKGTFTLSGVQVDDTKTLHPGIYIKDGKKIVIKN